MCAASIWYSTPAAQLLLAKGKFRMHSFNGHKPFASLASTKCVIGELRSGGSCTAGFSYLQRTAYPDWHVLLGSVGFLIAKIFVSEFPRFVQQKQ